MIDLRHERGMSSYVSNSYLQGAEISQSDVVSTLQSNVSEMLGTSRGGVYLTSGQTENSAVILNTALSNTTKNSLKVLTSVLDDFSTTTAIAPQGMGIVNVPIDSNGRIVEEDFIKRLTTDPDLVILTCVNEETGIVTCISRLARLVKEYSTAIVYVDCTYAAGWMDLTGVPVDVDFIGIDASKLGGPEGVGMLWVGSSVRLHPLYVKFNVSKNFNMLGAAALSAAMFETTKKLQDECERVREYRDILDQRMSLIPGVTVNCWNSPRVCNITSYNFKDVDSKILYLLLRKMGILTMYTAETYEGTTLNSPLMYCLYGEEGASNNIRIEISKETTEQEMEYTFIKLSKAYETLKKLHTCTE